MIILLKDGSSIIGTMKDIEVIKNVKKPYILCHFQKEGMKSVKIAISEIFKILTENDVLEVMRRLMGKVNSDGTMD